VRAAQILELKTPPSVVDLPNLADGLSVVAVALNPLDLAVGSGVFYGGHPVLPYVPGCEAVARRADGSCVYLFGEGHGTTRNGFLAERVAASDDVLLELPPEADPVKAAAIGIAGVAAWAAAAWKAQIGAGDRVLVLGASGAVGHVAVQAAQLLGASEVLGVSRSGAGGTVPPGTIAEAFGNDGFTVCIDPLWGRVVSDAIRYAARGARIVHLGQSAGPEATFRSADVRGKQLTIQGHSNFEMTKADRDKVYRELLDHVTEGRIEIPTRTYPLDDIASAWAHQGEGPHEKVVVVFDDAS
jgi:NADPH:quinone reductase